MRNQIVFILPFIQIVIALVTLSKLPEPPPQYFCKQARDFNGTLLDYMICNPNNIPDLP